MGSIARVNIIYEDLEVFLPKIDMPIYGAFMKGDVIYKEEFLKEGILILGNEANGISSATAIILSEIKGRQ